MKRRQLILFLIVVLAPLALTAWLGARYVRYQEMAYRDELETVLRDQLRATDAEVQEYFRVLRQLVRPSAPLTATSVARIRTLQRELPTVEQYFLLDSEGELNYPSAAMEITERERGFIERTRDIWERGDLPAGARDETGTRADGWYTSHRGQGIELIYWWREPNGWIAGAALNSSRVLADIIGLLPTLVEPAQSRGPTRSNRFELVGASGDTLYAWGAIPFSAEGAAVVSIPMSEPLQSWRLQVYSQGVTGSDSPYVALSLGMLALFSIGIVGIAVYLFRDQSRDLREARQRVNFVNQVSHELKTPLTNIRMYAELLNEDLDDDDAQSRKRLGVIVEESQRLSRLIGNVLTFGRGQREALRLHPRAGVPDEAIADTVEHFRPSLSGRGIDPVVQAGAGCAVAFDPDVLEQVLGNLLSNVEKYAAGADRVLVTSRQENSTLSVTVEDNGPGIPAKERDRIFEPFHRVSDKLTDGVAGTGIGLSIARDLARLHGGDLVLEPTGGGARFTATFRTEELES